MSKERGGSQRGQALAEYHVLYPGSILVGLLALMYLAGGTSDFLGSGIDKILEAIGGSLPPAQICLEESQITGQAGGSFCEQSEYCDHLDPVNVPGCSLDFNDCSVSLAQPGVVVIKAGQEYHIYLEAGPAYSPKYTDDGCYVVQYEDGRLIWQKAMLGNGCQDVSHVQAWHQVQVQTTCPPTEG